MKFKTETITPQMAADYLEKNYSNRTLKEHKIAKYARLMREGKFMGLNGETIKFCKSGRMIDGQNRLNAIIRANVPLTTTVVYDVSDKAMGNIDEGTPRNSGDVLTIAGVKNANTLSGIIKYYHDLKRGAASRKANTAKQFSNQEVLDEYNNDAELYEFAFKKASSLYAQCNGILTKSIIGSYYLYLRDYNANRVDDFFTKLCTGANIDIDDPIMTLRNKLFFFKNHADKVMTNKMRYDFIVKTWNNYLRGKKSKRLMYDERNNPTPKKH